MGCRLPLSTTPAIAMIQVLPHDHQQYGRRAHYHACGGDDEEDLLI
jgi:hypothetical protein